MPWESVFQQMSLRIKALEEEEALRREAEEKLKQSERRYRSIFEEAGAPAIIIEPDMTISMSNQEMEKLLGYAKHEIEGKMKWPQIVAAKDVERMIGYHFARRRGEKDVPREYECQLVAKDGGMRDIFAKVAMIPETQRSIASFMDITQRKRAEKALAESEARLRAIVEATQAFIYTCGQDRRLEFVNRALARHLGGDKVGEPCHSAIFGLDKPCAFCGLEQVLAGKNTRSEVWSPRDGRWYSMIGSPITDQAGRVLAQHAMMIDITERKLDEEARKAREEHLLKENLRLKTTLTGRYKFGGIIGKSQAMQEVYDLILNAVATDASVIIHGESGTGKELVAKAIHELSDRKNASFVVVHCGAVPENLLESEFFGYRKGAFTGAVRDTRGYLDLADHGTLFLDEIGEIGPNMQVKLLRAIDGGGYTPLGGGELKYPDIRIIAATNRDLRDHVAQGRMREDFFYRVHVVPIRVPHLRERKEDIPLLVEHFLSAYEESKRPPVTELMMDALMSYDWPGNVRELQNTLHRYATLKKLELMGAHQRPSKTQVLEPLEVFDLRAAMTAYEKRHIHNVLQKAFWSRTAAAQALGINRKTLFKKMKSFGIGKPLSGA